MENKIDWKKIHSEFVSGITKRELCKKYKVSKMTIYRNFVKLGLSLKKDPALYALRGEKHPNWKGGSFQLLKDLYQQLRVSKEYKNWRKEVFKRDNYSCILCNSNEDIQAHHKIKLREILKDIDKIEEAFKIRILLDISNGVTLCSVCHRKIHKGKQGDLSQKSTGLGGSNGK